MRILKLVLIPMIFAVSAIVVRAGGGDDWTIVQATGQMWVLEANALQRASISDGATVSPGATLSTGPSARVMLRRGRETMIVGPNTIMSLPQDSDRFYTTVIQVTGAIEFDVEKRNVTHFAVKTPLLAAVVKGTHFVVQAGDVADTVAVDRGRVEVQALASGGKVDVLPGQSARVSGDGIELSATGRRAQGQGNADIAAATGNGGGISIDLGSGDGLSLTLRGGNGVNLGLGGGGLSAGIGGESGVNANAGGGNGVSAGVGGSGGIGVSAGGGDGIGLSIGGLNVGIEGR